MAMTKPAHRHFLFVTYEGWGLCRPLIAIACRLLQLDSDLRVTLLVPGGFGDKVAIEIERVLSANLKDRAKIIHYAESRHRGQIQNEEREGLLGYLLGHLETVVPPLLRGQHVVDSLSGRQAETWSQYPQVIITDVELTSPSHEESVDRFIRHEEAALGKRSILLNWIPVSTPRYAWSGLSEVSPYDRLFTEASTRIRAGEDADQVFEHVFGSSDEVVHIPHCAPIYAYEGEGPLPDMRFVKAATDGKSSCDTEGQTVDGCLVNWPASMSQQVIALKRKQTPYFWAISPFIPRSADRGSIDVRNEEINRHLEQSLQRHGEKSVLYIAFGTWEFPPSVRQLHLLLQALREVDNPYIFMSGTAPPECRTIIDQAVAASDGQGITASWVGQSELLHHPAVAAFLTHCGSNSTVEAIDAGTHIICWPGCLDQPWIANEMTQTEKTGVDLKQIRSHIGRPTYDGTMVTGKDEDILAELRAVFTDVKENATSVQTSRQNMAALRSRLVADVQEGGETALALKELVALGKETSA